MSEPEPLARSEPPPSTNSRQHLRMDDFKLLSVIGRGVFTSGVMLAEDKASKHLYAIKVYKKEMLIENGEVIGPWTERDVLIKATREEHPFIVQFYGSFQTETKLFLVLEYMAGGDLQDHISNNTITPEAARFYGAEILLALKYLHANHILYRQLQLENVLLAPSGHIKLTDFILAKQAMFPPSRTSTFCGGGDFTPAPEMLLDQPYGLPVDWWHYGILMYKLLTNQAPFRGDDDDEIYDAALSDGPIYPAHLPPTAVSFLQHLLARDPALRLGAGKGGAEDVMGHAYFAGMDWVAVYERRVRPPFVPGVGRSAAEVGGADPLGDGEGGETVAELTAEMQDQFRGFSSMVEWLGGGGG